VQTAESPPSTSGVDPASVHANELGLVPVLMYHQIVAAPGADRYNQTPAQFLNELTTLYADGYVPVTAAAFVAGSFNVPAGKHPVVLTFDDSTVSQFGLTNGVPKPGTAVALLLAFSASHPGFPAVATMYVNFAPPPFAGTDATKALRWLVDHGFEIGDHTLSHQNLRTAGPVKAQQEIAADLTAIQAALPDYRVTTLALPFGVHPQPASLAWSGSSGGTSYHFDGVMEVGANPAHSPYSAAFDGTRIPRIRSQSLPGADAPYESKHWLEWLRAHRELLFTSDGDASRVSYPRTSKQSPAAKFRALSRPY
jgi:peptidoglycan/xylan/chitin deacetylase (PgdA/CDA1 family)